MCVCLTVCVDVSLAGQAEENENGDFPSTDARITKAFGEITSTRDLLSSLLSYPWFPACPHSLQIHWNNLIISSWCHCFTQNNHMKNRSCVGFNMTIMIFVRLWHHFSTSIFITIVYNVLLLGLFVILIILNDDSHYCNENHLGQFLHFFCANYVFMSSYLIHW